MQFGTYATQTFNWLMSTDLGYIHLILVAEDPPDKKKMKNPIMIANKASLLKYVELFPEVIFINI